MSFPAKANVEEEEDEILATYDVYAAQQLTGNLQLFQFPLRPMSRPYEMSRVKLNVTKGVGTAQAAEQKDEFIDSSPTLVNPNSRLSMKIELDTFASDSFRPSTSDDPYAKPDANVFSYQLESAPFTAKSNYALGVVHDNEIHLTPVAAIQQFTPVTKQRSSGITEDHVSKVVSSGNTMGGAVQSTLEKQLKRLRSVALAEDAETKEPWDYFPNTSVESKTVAQRLFSSTLTDSSHTETKRLDPVDAFFPRDNSRDIGATLQKHVVARYAENYTIPQQVDDLVRSCQVVTLPLLQQHVQIRGAEEPPLPELVAALKRRAVYIHGMWVAAESSKYQHNSAAVREVVLMQFARSADGAILRKDVNAFFAKNTTVLPTVKQVLEDVAKLEEHEDPKQRRWRLRMSEDAAASAALMQQHFAEDCLRQQRNWQSRAEGIRANAALINAGRSVPTKSLTLVFHDGATASAAAAQRGGASSIDVSSLDPKKKEELTAVATETIRKLFRQHGVLNRTVAKEHLRTLTKRAGDRLYQCPDAILVTAMKALLMPFTETTWIMQRPENEMIADQRRYLIAAMRQKPEFTLQQCIERATQLLHHELQTKGENTAGREITSAAATTVANEVATWRQGEKLWHVKNGMAKL